jgi:IS5 family transposase
MAWKMLQQQTLADALMSDHEALKELDGLNALIDWKLIELKLSEVNNKAKGERAFPPLMMFKILLLQSWYNLSDPATEKQLARDLLFRRFIDLSLSESVPDHSTIWRFRNHLQKQGLYEPLLMEINDQLVKQGLMIRCGEVSIIDASVIQAQRNRPNKNKKGDNTQDAQAAYNVKTASDGQKKTTYGFKVHMNVDEDGFIKAQELTAGNVHDSQVFESLLTGNEHEVYADSAYKSKAHDQILDRNRIKNRVLERAYRNRELTETQKQSNRYASQTRSVIERTFGVLKKYYGLGQARYLGLARNSARVYVMCMAHNIKRAMNIKLAF